MNNFLISVIIPNYNYARYIEQCLQSVLDSDFEKMKMEIIVVDDASTDASVKVVHDMMNDKRFPFKLIRNETNLGLILSRNLGIKFANGEFLFFLDPDNYIGKDCIKNHYHALNQNPDVIACYAPIQDFLNDTGEYCGTRSNRVFDYHQLLEGPYIDAMAMFRKKELIEIKMYDNQMPKYGWEDYELWLRLGKIDKKVVFIEGEPLSFYRKHNLNMSQNFTSDQYNHLVYYLKQRYPIKLPLHQSEILECLIHHKIHLAQLFHNSTNSQNNVVHSLFSEFVEGSQRLIFKFENPQLVKNLRFDPLNDYLQVQINSIELMYKGKAIDAHFTLSSNAISTQNTVYLFDTKDPQIYIDFEKDVFLEIDEVIIDLNYVKTGIETSEPIISFKENLIKKQQEEIIKGSLKNETIALQNENLVQKIIIEEVKNQELLELYDQLKHFSDSILLENKKNLEALYKHTQEKSVLEENNYQINLRLNRFEEKYNEQQKIFNELISSKNKLEKQNQFYIENNKSLEIKLIDSHKTVDDLAIRLKQSGKELDNLKSIPGIRYFHKIMFSLKHFIPVGRIKSILARIKYFRNYYIIKHSALFDEAYYLKNNPDVLHSGMPAVKHYLLFGGFEGRNPSKVFDSANYIEQIPVIKDYGINPLIHFIRFGQKEGQNVSPD